MMRSGHLVAALTLAGVTALANASCVAEARAGGYVAAGPPVEFVEPPTLVQVDSNVWVVSDYEYPVYYVDGYFWTYWSNFWYRSPSYETGWERTNVSFVPRAIATRDHRAYVHYHGSAHAPRRVAPPSRMTPASLTPAAGRRGGPGYRSAPPGLERREDAIERHDRAMEQRDRESERRERAIEERGRADEERGRPDEERGRADEERGRADEEPGRADEERGRADEEPGRAEEQRRPSNEQRESRPGARGRKNKKPPAER